MWPVPPSSGAPATVFPGPAPALRPTRRPQRAIPWCGRGSSVQQPDRQGEGGGEQDPRQVGDEQPHRHPAVPTRRPRGEGHHHREQRDVDQLQADQPEPEEQWGPSGVQQQLDRVRSEEERRAVGAGRPPHRPARDGDHDVERDPHRAEQPWVRGPDREFQAGVDITGSGGRRTSDQGGGQHGGGETDRSHHASERGGPRLGPALHGFLPEAWATFLIILRRTSPESYPLGRSPSGRFGQAPTTNLPLG